MLDLLVVHTDVFKKFSDHNIFSVTVQRLIRANQGRRLVTRKRKDVSYIAEKQFLQ